MIRIAVLGCGRIGVMHAAKIAAHPHATLARVYDIHAPSAKTEAALRSIAGGCMARTEEFA